jgi:hypothetical protein
VTHEIRRVVTGFNPGVVWFVRAAGLRIRTAISFNARPTGSEPGTRLFTVGGRSPRQETVSFIRGGQSLVFGELLFVFGGLLLQV